MKKTKIIPIIGATLIAAFSSITANASPVTSNMNTQVTIAASCTISIPTVDFGITAYEYDKTALGRLTSRCSKGIQAILSLSGGNSADPETRYMTNASNPNEKLFYHAHKPGNSDISLYDGTNGTSTIAITGTGADFLTYIGFYTLRGQYVTAGAYSDNLTVTLTY